MTEQITVRGYVATDPESRNLPDGTVVVTFRLASTPRWFDQQTGSWRDGHTNWFSVQAFRSLALNTLASIRTGQPVVVVGKLKVRFWEGEHGRNTAVDVDAVSIGHDLALGTACFQRTVSSAPSADRAGERPAGEAGGTTEAGAPEHPTPPQDGSPSETGDPSDGGAGPVVPADVDPETGELLAAAADPRRRSRRQPAAT
ncbi:single-stranded DNA-binding protein [Kocuria sp. NPDC057446]|uniref:single-stranded DNA-binding protein n=1 Tax=Kocuria sp. NPDC057446 TaxID=3346137 RepID=UPI0036C7057E